MRDIEPEDEHRTGPTGPRSPEGKQTSSMNRLIHGCRSTKTLLPDEDPAEFEFLINSWFNQYLPEDPTAILLVQETGLAHWFYKRASGRLEDFEWNLPAEAANWTDEHHKRFQNFSRYKTTAQRSFLRFFNELQSHGDRSRDALQEAARLELAWLTKKQEAAVEEVKITQWVEVEVVDGQCQTSYYPSNQKLLEQVAARPKPPLFLKRWISFASGVPPEYAGVQPNSLQKTTESTGVQNMFYDDWLEVIEREKLAAGGHIGPSATSLRPLPKA